MKKILRRAPTLVVIGLAGSTAWPSFFPKGEAEATKGADRPPAITTPDSTGPPGRRNPFLAEHPPDAPTTKEATLASTRATGQAVAKADARAAGPPERPPDEDKAVAGMRLGGTLVDGREQFAVIDGRVYARGERLQGRDGSRLPYVVAEVRRDRAVLRRGRRDFVLAFSDAPRPAGLKGGVAGLVDPAGQEAPTGRPTATVGAQGVGRAKAPGGTVGPPIAMGAIMRLLLGAGGATPGGASPVGGIDAASLSAGIDALMGRHDDVGRTGGPTTAGNWGAEP